MIYWQLFLAYLQIGLFSIGGGHAAIPVVQSKIVDELGWLTMKEFTDVVTIAEITPGPLGINSATFIGEKIGTMYYGFFGGILGGFIATIASIIPSLIFVIAIALLYRRFNKLHAVQGALMGIRPAVTGLIFSAGFGILLLSWFGSSALWAISGVNVDYRAIMITVFSAVLLRTTKLNPVLVILLGGVLGILAYAL